MNHLPALDGLRGLAILAVVAYHGGWLRGGFVGVDLFFALSGFLITRLLLAEHARHGSILLRAFWIRRALRLGPALVAALLLAVVVSRRVGMPLEPVWIAATLLYSSNVLIGWLHVYPIGVLSHGWSLAMEEQFYLVWPPLLIGALRFGSRGVAIAAGALVFLPSGLRLAYRALHPVDPMTDPTLWLRIYFSPDMRFDAIALGCLGAVLPVAGLSAARSASLGPATGMTSGLSGAAGLAGLVWLGFVAVRADIGRFVDRPLLFNLTSVAATLVVLAAVLSRPFARVFEWMPLVALGRVSYGLYLYHVIVFVGLNDWPPAARVAASLALAILSFLLLERPFARLKQRHARGWISS